MVGIIGLHEVGGRVKSNSSFRFERVDFLYKFYFSCLDWLGLLSSPLFRVNKSIFRRFKCRIGTSGSIMLSRKILENWHLWILYNVVSIVIYISTGLYVMLILAIINLFICVAGLLEWKSNYKGQEHTNNYI